MGRPIDGEGLLGASMDLSHQEMSRLVGHLEELWSGFTQDGDGNSNGCEWLPVEQVGQLMCQELGYEDEPEFEDALKGSFTEFLGRLPHVVLKNNENGRTYFQLKPEPPREQWVPVRMTYKIASVADLWRLCHKSPHARIEIPELEFEISADGKRAVDSVYNHVGSAVYNLGNYVQQPGNGLSDDHKNKIMDTVIALNVLLDVPVTWTWVVHDPSGLSEFKPMDEAVTVEFMGPDGEPLPAEQQAEQRARIAARAAAQAPPTTAQSQEQQPSEQQPEQQQSAGEQP